ncbi:TonB family protein [Shewanella sp.]|uniref:TonB family protein n=1 Tax=Shewanella sp. TaxID=50422 RepID=UPI003A97AAF5
MFFSSRARRTVLSSSVCSLKTLSLAVALSSTFAVFTSTASEQTFADAYQAYKVSLQQNDKQQIEDAASAAFELGKAQYAADSINYAALAMNYAKAIVDDSFPSKENEARYKQAEDLYQQALDIYQKHYGEDAPQLADVYLGLASSVRNMRRVKSYAYDAIDVAKNSDDPLYQAGVQMAAFDVLVDSANYDRHAQRVALAAYDLYQKHAPANSVERIKAEYRVAQIYFSKRDYDKAESMFKDVIDQFAVLKFSHPYALSAHMMLVQLYEKEGEPDKANEHCQAVGKMRPWSAEQEQMPLYRAEPKYPRMSLMSANNGYVQVEFTVDTNGFVKDPEVVKSKGGDGFVRETVAALKQWRYAPKFEHGEAVAAKTMVQIDFEIRH